MSRPVVPTAAGPPAARPVSRGGAPSGSWFGALAMVIDNLTMLSIILTGAALIREQEHGAIEHLPAVPVTPSRS